MTNFVLSLYFASSFTGLETASHILVVFRESLSLGKAMQVSMDDPLTLMLIGNLLDPDCT